MAQNILTSEGLCAPLCNVFATISSYLILNLQLQTDPLAVTWTQTAKLFQAPVPVLMLFLLPGNLFPLSTSSNSILSFFFFLAALSGLRDPSSLTRDRTRVPGSESAKS